MLANALFDALAQTLERETHFDRLASRGTLRLALRASGLDRKASVPEMVEVISRALPEELVCSGVEEPERVCAALRRVAMEHADDCEEE